jgi:glycosyltransferase involved in cell wall biosynthesis
MDELVHLLRRTAGKSLATFVVWHGNTSQFHVDFEYDMFRRLLQRRKGGFIQGLACVKPDMHLISALLFPRTILNLPPRLDELPRERVLSGQAFIPVPNDWRKNLYTNLLAAHEVARIKQVVVTAEFTPFPGDEQDRVLRVHRPERAQAFRIMKESDVILNVTLSECQPMTAREGLALGTPCITGPLSFQECDDHPFQRLTEVCGVDSVREVRDAIEQVLDLREKSPAELREMMNDYSKQLRNQALGRYCEFLNL